VNAVFHISKRTLISVDEKLGRWGDEEVFYMVGATSMSSIRRRNRRSDQERISVDSNDSPGLGSVDLKSLNEFRDMVKALHRAGTSRAWDIESESLYLRHEIDRRSVDPAGLYQVGSFVGDSWREWNGRFRADTRDFSAAPRVQ
jgi:hypothetical protein